MPSAANATSLATSAAAALAVTGPLEHISGRKGSDTWRAGNWAIKTATPGARGHLAHEVDVYGLLHCQGRHPGARHGETAEGWWLGVPWLDGRPLWDVFAPAREGTATQAQRAEMRAAAVNALAELHRFHKAGWTHGDMQTENVVLLSGSGAIEFLDFDNAHHASLLLPFPYRGGLVHVIAPEVAAQLAATTEDEPVELTPAADVFALGASLYWAWTGVRITDYRGDPAAAHADLYSDIAAGRRRDLRTDRPWDDPELEGLIEAATRPDPAARLAA